METAENSGQEPPSPLFDVRLIVMNVSYVYNVEGKVEYAVVPILLWQKLSQSLGNESINAFDSKPYPFNPRNYKGLLSDLNIDVDSEISRMRNEWTRDI